MKIFVNSIPEKGLDQEEDLRSSDLGLDTEQISYRVPVHVQAHLEKSKDIVNAACRVTSRSIQTCSRCLAEFERPLEINAKFMYKIEGERAIELNDNIRDSLLLDYPLKILCSQDCKGLCMSCGKNLNEGPCDCKGGI